MHACVIVLKIWYDWQSKWNPSLLNATSPRISSDFEYTGCVMLEWVMLSSFGSMIHTYADMCMHTHTYTHTCCHTSTPTIPMWNE